MLKDRRGITGSCVPIASKCSNGMASSSSVYWWRYLSQELRIETVESRGDGGVGGEQISRAGHGHGQFERHLVILHVAAGSFENGERSVAFVQVAHLRLEAESPQQAPAADTQDDLLLQPHFCIAAVEFAGDAALGGGIGEIVGVQKVEFVSPHADFPAAKPDFRLRQLNLYP